MDHLLNPTEDQFQEIVLDLKSKLTQGDNISELNGSLTDEEINLSVKTLRNAADKLGAVVTPLTDLFILSEPNAADTTAADATNEYLIRVKSEDVFHELRVAVIGNVDAGKTSMLGVLTSNKLDDGRGKARLLIAKHKHEAETGRTSSVGNTIIGFDAHGRYVDNGRKVDNNKYWAETCAKSAKVVSFIDLAGHEKYIKTTIFGMTGHKPDYCMVIIGANAGLIGMTKEHLGIALTLKIPFYVIVTKIDICPPEILQNTLEQLNGILKSRGVRKVPLMVNSMDDVLIATKSILSDKVCPVFQISNVARDTPEQESTVPLNYGIERLKTFLNLLPYPQRWTDKYDLPAEYSIGDVYFKVEGTSVVVSGMCSSGTISIDDKNLVIGPDFMGKFWPVTIRSIQVNRYPSKCVRAGFSSTFSLRLSKDMEVGQVRKGMYIMDKSIEPIAVREFEASAQIIYIRGQTKSTKIGINYQSMIHTGPVKQTAKIRHMPERELKNGTKVKLMEKGVDTTIRFRFIMGPEYLHVGDRLIFREGRTKGIGTITKLFPMSETEGKDGLDEIDGIRKHTFKP